MYERPSKYDFWLYNVEIQPLVSGDKHVQIMACIFDDKTTVFCLMLELIEYCAPPWWSICGDV